MSGSRRSRRSDVWRAPMRPPKGVAITTAPPSDDRLMKKTNIPNISRSTSRHDSYSSTSSDDDDFEGDRYSETADFQYEQIPSKRYTLTPSNLNTNEYVDQSTSGLDDLYQFKNESRSSIEYNPPQSTQSTRSRHRETDSSYRKSSISRNNSSKSTSNRSGNRSGNRSDNHNSGNHNSDNHNSASSSKRRLTSSTSPSAKSPNHGAMGAAFHSVLVKRVTRTHQGGKNLGARMFFCKRLIIVL